ncbi:hypothetical protein AB9N12_00720 [Bacteroides sp. AN502(2024)]|uniref:hypothetical protein n=1 Tax=Bacteroides sp. AN502(2024) TaxID=3160599 RepID=UPI0035194242
MGKVLLPYESKGRVPVLHQVIDADKGVGKGRMSLEIIIKASGAGLAEPDIMRFGTFGRRGATDPYIRKTGIPVIEYTVDHSHDTVEPGIGEYKVGFVALEDNRYEFGFGIIENRVGLFGFQKRYAVRISSDDSGRNMPDHDPLVSAIGRIVGRYLRKSHEDVHEANR